MSKLFILYTGGTFGMKQDANNSLEPSTWDEIVEYLPAIKNQKFFNHFKDISFTFKTLLPIIDSSSITPKHWSDIADIIESNYQTHDGFIVIHGTDTMAYTASALSFVFENLAKPIVLTGAQLPIYHPRTDGIVNISNAIYIAGAKAFGLPVIPEVCICFNDDLLRGNRTTKTSTNDFEGFDSPNFTNLAHLEQTISFNNEVILQPKQGELVCRKEFSEKVVNVTVFPGYNTDVLLEMVQLKRIEGIVLKSFGSGNLPNSSKWDDLVKACELNNVPLLVTTQCNNGRIEIGRYKASSVLQNSIVANGIDITSEAALTKLMWVIGNFKQEEIMQVLSSNLRGEISTNN